MRNIFTVMLLLSMQLAPLHAFQLPDGTSVSVKETVLMQLSPQTEDDISDVVISDDMTRCAMVMTTPEGRPYLYHRGRKSQSHYMLIANFSAKHLVSVTVERNFDSEEIDAGRESYAVDGKVIPGCQGVFFNKDDSHVAYLIQVNDQYRMKIDAVTGPLFDRIDVIGWTADQRHYRYLGYRGYDIFYLLDHEERAKIPPQGPHAYPKISPDGRRVAYVESTKDQQYFLHVDDQRFGPYGYEEIGPLFFSPDSQRYVAEIYQLAGENDEKEGKRRLLIDGIPQPWYRNITQAFVCTDPNNTYYFSADSRHVAYAAEEKPGSWRQVVDGVVSTETYDDMSHPIYSSDSQHIGHVAMKKENEITWSSVFIDGKEQHRFPYGISGLSFSPDFHRWHVTRIEEEQPQAGQAEGREIWSLVTSDGNQYRNTDSWYPVYTVDSRHLVYLAENGEDDDNDAYRIAIYVDGVKVSADYRQCVMNLQINRQGMPQAVFLQWVIPKRGKPYWVVVRLDMSLGAPE